MLHRRQLVGVDHPHLSGLSLEASLGDAHPGAARRYERDRTILEAGESSTHFFQVVGGTIRSAVLRADGTRQILDFYVAGEIFGLNLAAGARASFEAATSCELMPYRRADFISAAYGLQRRFSLWGHT